MTMMMKVLCPFFFLIKKKICLLLFGFAFVDTFDGGVEGISGKFKNMS